MGLKGKIEAVFQGIHTPQLSKTKKSENTTAAQGAKKITTVNMQPNKSIERKDLDKLGFYAGLVDISKKPPVGSVDSYAQVGSADFGKHWPGGNLTISSSGKKEANEYLNAYNLALKDYAKVAPHLESGMADIEKAMNLA